MIIVTDMEIFMAILLILKCFRLSETKKFSLNIGLNMLPSDLFVSCLTWYSTGEFQALQLIIPVVFGAVDQPLNSSMLVHFLEVKFEMTVGL